MSDAPLPADFHDQVSAVIDSIRPYIQGDGGDIRLVDTTDDGTVKVQLTGACSGCPHAAITLKIGVERTLKQKVPGVREVVHVE